MSYNNELEKSIENNLFELYCKNFESGRDAEVFSSLTHSIREIISKKWFESLKVNNRKKILYILSFEYSFGDKLLKNLIRLNLLDEVKDILKKNNKNFNDINSQDIDFALGFSDLGEWTTQLIETLSTQKENVFAYGLRYRRGMLKQEIVNGMQVERPQEWKVNKNPWEHEKAFSHKVNFGDYSVQAVPYDLPILSADGEFVNTLRLWKSNSTENLDFELFSKGQIFEAYKNINRANAIVEFLYPSEKSINGRKLRLTQEYFFASASIQDILKRYKKYTDNDIDKISEYLTVQINDTHPILSILVFIDLVMKKYHLDFDRALEIAKSVFEFVHMNLLPESFGQWELEFINEVCPELVEIITNIDRKIGIQSYGLSKEVRLVNFGKVNMLNLAYYVSKKIITTTFDRFEMIKTKYLTHQYKLYKDKFSILKYNFDYSNFCKRINSESNQINFTDTNSLFEIKEKNKEQLIKNFGLDPKDYNTKAPFIMQLGVFHENKRQLLAVLSVAYLYYRLKKNPNLDIPERVYLFGGKSYANYFIAKETIKVIIALRDLINNDLFIKDKIKIIFIENYDLTKENKLLPSSDILLNLNVYAMSSNEVLLKKSILCGSNLVLTNSNDILEKDYDIYRFGRHCDGLCDTRTDSIVDFISENSQLRDMLNFFRNLNNGNYYFDVENIKNTIYYYNDAYDIVRELREYTQTIELAIKDYINKEKWSDKIFKNTDLVNSQSNNEIKYFENLEG